MTHCDPCDDGCRCCCGSGIEEAATSGGWPGKASLRDRDFRLKDREEPAIRRWVVRVLQACAEARRLGKA